MFLGNAKKGQIIRGIIPMSTLSGPTVEISLAKANLL